MNSSNDDWWQRRYEYTSEFEDKSLRIFLRVATVISIFNVLLAAFLILDKFLVGVPTSMKVTFKDEGKTKIGTRYYRLSLERKGKDKYDYYREKVDVSKSFYSAVVEKDSVRLFKTPIFVHQKCAEFADSKGEKIIDTSLSWSFIWSLASFFTASLFILALARYFDILQSPRLVAYILVTFFISAKYWISLLRFLNEVINSSIGK